MNVIPMNPAFIPINPLRTNDGNVVSLEGLRGALKAQPIPLDPGTTVQNSMLSSGGQQISVSLAANLGIGTIFTSDVKATETGFWLDACAFADSATKPTDDNIISKTRWGYGFRMLFRARQLDVNFKLTFATIGAGLHLGLASASYEVQTIGMGPEALIAIMGGLSQFGVLNGETFHELNTTVIKNLAVLIKKHGYEYHVRPLAVQIKIPAAFDPVVKARSEVYAMRRIRKGNTLEYALEHAGASRNPEAIRAVYKKVAGNIPDTERPSDSACDAAKAWLG